MHIGDVRGEPLYWVERSLSVLINEQKLLLWRANLHVKHIKVDNV